MCGVLLFLNIKVYGLESGKTFLVKEQRFYLHIPRLLVLVSPILPPSLAPGKPLVIEISNGGLRSFSGTVNVVFLDPTGKTVGKGSKVLSQTLALRQKLKLPFDIIPSKLRLGTYKLKYEFLADGQRWHGESLIPCEFFLFAGYSVVSTKLGEKVEFRTFIKNTGRFTIAPKLSWSLANGAAKGGPTQMKPLQAGERRDTNFSVTVPRNLRKGFHDWTLKASLDLSEGRSSTAPLFVSAPLPSLSFFLPGNLAAGQKTTLQVGVEPDCCFVPPFSGTLAVSIPAFKFSYKGTLTFSSIQNQTKSLQLLIPSTAKPGSYKFSAHFTLPSGHQVKRESYLVLSGAVLKLAYTGKSSVKAGSPLSISLANTGGAAASYTWTGELRSSQGEVAATGKGAGSLQPGAKSILTLRFPNDSPTGNYKLRVTATANNKTIELNTLIQVSGSTASLTLSTSKSIYASTEKIQGNYQIKSGPTSLQGAQFNLRVVGYKRFDSAGQVGRYPTPLQKGIPWPMYRGSAARLSAAPGTAIFTSTNAKVLWRLRVETKAGTGDRSPRAPVIADLDQNGKIDVVGVTASGDLVALQGANGKLLWRAVASAKGSPAVANLDGKNGPEVVISTMPCHVRVLNGKTGASLWSKAISGQCFPTGSPLLADLNGNKQLDIAVSAGMAKQRNTTTYDVLAVLDGENGESLAGYRQQSIFLGPCFSPSSRRLWYSL